MARSAFWASSSPIRPFHSPVWRGSLSTTRRWYLPDQSKTVSCLTLRNTECFHNSIAYMCNQLRAVLGDRSLLVAEPVRLVVHPLERVVEFCNYIYTALCSWEAGLYWIDYLHKKHFWKLNLLFVLRGDIYREAIPVMGCYLWVRAYHQTLPSNNLPNFGDTIKRGTANCDPT